MDLYYEKEPIEVGVDEVGRGCLFGRVYAAAVIWPKENNPNIEHPIMKDSKKYSKKKLIEMEKYVKENCLAYSIGYIEHDIIDEINILKATYKAMHSALNNLDYKFDKIIVDGNRFDPYMDQNCDIVPHSCIIEGDTKYYPIAAASILAKCARDKYVKDLCLEYPEFDTRYKLSSNVGYGSKHHLDGIKEHGITKFHRKTFGICKNSPVTL